MRKVTPLMDGTGLQQSLQGSAAIGRMVLGSQTFDRVVDVGAVGPLVGVRPEAKLEVQAAAGGLVADEAQHLQVAVALGIGQFGSADVVARHRDEEGVGKVKIRVAQVRREVVAQTQRKAKRLNRWAASMDRYCCQNAWSLYQLLSSTSLAKTRRMLRIGLAGCSTIGLGTCRAAQGSDAQSTRSTSSRIAYTKPRVSLPQASRTGRPEAAPGTKPSDSGESDTDTPVWESTSRAADAEDAGGHDAHGPGGRLIRPLANSTANAFGQQRCLE